MVVTPIPTIATHPALIIKIAALQFAILFLAIAVSRVNGDESSHRKLLCKFAASDALIGPQTKPGHVQWVPLAPLLAIRAVPRGPPIGAAPPGRRRCRSCLS